MTTDDKPTPDDKREINIAAAAEWLRRSDGTHWHVRGYQIGMDGPDGFTLRRAYRASEAQRASEAREPDIQVPDLAALRRDFVVNMRHPPSPAPSPAEEAMKAMVDTLPDPMAEAAAYYDSVQRPMSVRHVSLNADGSFTMAYEEGAMDPVKPRKPVSLCRAPVENATGDTAPCSFSLGHPGEHDPNAHMHPAPNLPPWKWEEKDGQRWLVNGDGHPVRTGRIVGDKIVDSHESELQRAAPEMARLLREWKGHPIYDHGVCDCLYCRTTRVLTRIDDAARGG